MCPDDSMLLKVFDRVGNLPPLGVAVTVAGCLAIGQLLRDVNHSPRTMPLQEQPS